MRDVILNITIRTKILDKKEEIDIPISVMNELHKDDVSIDDYITEYMKNTFAKLRRTNKALKNKFEESNESLRLATEEIDRLNKALDIKEKELSYKIYSLYYIKYRNYNAWIEEHETNGKLSIVLTIMSLVIFGLIGTIIGILR